MSHNNLCFLLSVISLAFSLAAITTQKLKVTKYKQELQECIHARK